MALFRRSPRPTVITAAASQIRDPQDPSARSKAPDAAYLYGLYSELGPVHAAMQSKFYAASKITYFPAVIVDPEDDPEPLDDGPAVEAFLRIQGPNGDFAKFISEMALHWEIPGEGYLVGQDIDGADEWDVWSPVEYDENRQGLRTDLDADAAKAISEGDFIMRSWRAHPMKRSKPDSPMRAVVRQCEQYLAFSDMLTSLAQSRLVAPLFHVPAEMDFPTTDTNGNAQTFGSWLSTAMSAAVSDPRNANRITPIVIELPTAFAPGLGTIDLTRDLEEWVPEVMERILRQIAIGLDIPAEILTGLADVNHWGQWLIDDSLRLNYVDPLVLDVLDSFTRGYLWPALEAQRVPDFERFLFWRDYSDLTSRSVTAADALAAYSVVPPIISAAATRRTIGFTEADAPDEAELEARAPVIPEPVVVEEVQAIPETLVAAAAPASLAAIDHRLYTQLSEAAQAALDRALEKAGQRVRSQIRGDSRRSAQDPLAAAIMGLDPMVVPFTVGRQVVTEALQLSEEDLIPESTFDRLTQRTRKILSRGQTDTRETIGELTGTIPEPEPEEDNWITAALAALVAGMVGLARRKLFTPDLAPDPSETGEVGDSDIPAQLVFDAMTLAGGGVPGDFATRGMATGEYGISRVESVGFEVKERRWETGAPTVPFDPHQRLEGFQFAQWTNERLRPPLSAAWLGIDFMHPGDHRGCQCVAELVIAEAFRGEASPTPAGLDSGPIELMDKAQVPIWNPDTRTFIGLRTVDVEYVGFEGVPPDIQAAIKRGVNAYPPEFRPPRVEVSDTLGGPSGRADSFGIKLGEGKIELSKEMWTQKTVSGSFERMGETAIARVEHVVRHELGHWKQSILDDQAQRVGLTKRLTDLSGRLDAVVDDLIPDLETAEAMGLDYPWLVRDASKKQIPGAPGNWDKEWFAELSAHLSEGRPLPQPLADLVNEYHTFAQEKI